MSNKHILIITVDSAFGNLLADSILRPASYRVTLAQDMPQAENALHSSPPDLVILDFNLQEAPFFAEKFAERLPTTPLIFAITQKDVETLEQALELGATYSIFPPWEPEAILKTLERSLQNRAHLESWAGRRSHEMTDALRRRLDILETLQQIGQSVTSTLDLEGVLTKVVDAAVGLTNAEEGSLLIVDEDSGELYMRAARNFQDDFVRTFRLPMNDTLAGQVVRTGRSVIIDNDTPQKIKTSYLVRSLIYVPLKIQNRVIGVLGVDTRTGSQIFNEQHLTLMSALADYAAIAIENARLYHNTEVERHKLETILKGIGDGVIVIREDHRVVLINPTVATAFGVTEASALHQSAEQVFSHAQLLDLFKEESYIYPYRAELTLDDGRVMNAQLAQIPEVGLAITMQDITHLKELDRIKSDFVNTISHDLRSPLTAILGYIELLGRVGPINQQQQNFVERVQVSVRNITTLINDLLELGRIESGFDARKEFVPLTVIVQYSADSLESSIIEKELKLSLDLPGKTQKVFGDPTRLRQMVDNLLGNSIRYTPRGGAIRVSIKPEIDQIILQIQDTGPGIPPSDQPYIFDKFYRGSNVPDIPGTGLGLAIVKTIVENHQGRVWVDSALGQGSTFTVVLPVADDSLNGPAL